MGLRKKVCMQKSSAILDFVVNRVYGGMKEENYLMIISMRDAGSLV